MSLPRLLPLSKAAQALGIPEEDLRTQIEAGKILAGVLPDGEIVVSMSNGSNSTRHIPKEELPAYKKHAHLQEVEIGIGEAAREYNLNQPTISKWVKAGYIRVIGHEGQKVLIDKADVAYCAEIYHGRGGRGKWLFNTDGTPYIPKSD